MNSDWLGRSTQFGETRIARKALWLAIIGAVLLAAQTSVGLAMAQTPVAAPATSPTAKSPDLEIVEATVRYLSKFDVLVFELQVAGEAGGTTPDPHGDLDGAPVLGYVVPTTLPPAAVGFSGAEGTVALAVTSHPDFDDTPLWDETADGDYANDGAFWHTHWVLLGPDDRVPGALAVLAVSEAQATEALPPTNPGLPIYLDSPGFSVQRYGATLRVVVPAPRVGSETSFSFDAVSAFMAVNTSDESRPTLGVYDVYGVLSGDLSLPYHVHEE